ncbi:MAG TPA: carboxylesterase/lipase family protein [Pseudomonadales bacterium]
MTIAETTSGPVQGRIKDGALLFAGIPYAAPPVGSNRFRAAQPVEPWREVRDATRFGPAAPQVPGGGLTDSAPVRWSEDCLTLNVCTPALDAARRPVLFWIHGGGYRTGQGAIPWYNGARFATRGDIVVVSINYRLGALGFTDLSPFGDDYATSGANGLLDQITALRWVRQNIEHFGGDPDRVTIAGESAGAFSVCTLLASPLARGLFRAAIAQSGGAQHTLPTAAGQVVAQRLLEELRDDAALQALPVEQILAAQQRVAETLGDGAAAQEHLGVAVAPFYPVEGNPVVPAAPLDAIVSGASRGIPLLTGTNRHETTLFGYGDADAARLERIARRYGAEPTLGVYRRTRPEATPAELLIALTTDHMFRIPAIRLLEARAGQPATPSWMYWFCWESRAFEGRLRSTHALEIPFAFDNLDKPGVEVFLGPGERPRALAERMHRAWIDFVRDGDPGWAPYEPQRRATMKFDLETELLFDPDGEERAAWEGLR